MKKLSHLIIALGLTVSAHLALATQADDTIIAIGEHTAGATPFISQVTLTASDTTTIKSIQFSIAPKSGSVTRPLAATYSNAYLTERGDLDSSTGEIFLPVYGLYAAFSNTVILTYYFNDGSSKQDAITIATDSFTHPCDLDNPTVLQARTDTTSLSYDYMLVKGGCAGGFVPAIVDTDGALRWASPAGFSVIPATFYDNAVYQTSGSALYRVDLDGTITMLHDYADIGATFLHHNIDYGKVGLILDLDTADQIEATNIEVDGAGNVLKTWHLDQIISDAMTAGGDDPSQFVYSAPTDWFHNNATTYNRASDTFIVSSRENFVIGLDYETGTIKWILGDETKHWHQFPSLAQYSLALGADTLAPIGEHALSITYDQHLLLMDNGYNSIFQMPPGLNRSYASPRKYQLNLNIANPATASPCPPTCTSSPGIATEVWNYEMDQSILSPICSSIYEDAPLNYVIDYAFVGGFGANTPYAQLLGLDAAGEKIFYYQYPTRFCDTAYNAIPLHLERTSFPTVMARNLNISTRGNVGPGDDALIGGFIVTGSEPQTIIFRALGPSLGAMIGNSATLADPNLTIYDSTGAEVGSNDNWEFDPGADQITAEGFAPTDPAEAATIQTLDPGAYTFVVRGADEVPGIALVEAYDLSPLADSRLANISTRGLIGFGDDVLISGFIVGEVDSTTVVLRAIGPSLGTAGLDNALTDPSLTVYDSNGASIATNDNWHDDISATDIEQNGLAPSDDAESATLLHLPAGAYTAIVSPADGTSSGVGLVEVYDLQ
ncbi:MAG: aryl-sulfate sulfotransferase [Chthoniobacterales bacterium]